MNYASQKLTKGMFRKIEIKNGFSMIVADYKRNGSPVLITPFDPNFFHDEGEYLFIEPTNEDLQKSPIKISLFGEIYPVHCMEVIEETLANKKISVYKSSFFVYSSELKKIRMTPLFFSDHIRGIIIASSRSTVKTEETAFSSF